MVKTARPPVRRMRRNSPKELGGACPGATSRIGRAETVVHSGLDRVPITLPLVLGLAQHASTHITCIDMIQCCTCCSCKKTPHWTGSTPANSRMNRDACFRGCCCCRQCILYFLFGPSKEHAATDFGQIPIVVKNKPNDRHKQIQRSYNIVGSFQFRCVG